MDASIKIYVGCLGAAFLIVSAILILVLLHIKKIHRELTAFCGDTFPDDKNYIRTLNMKEKIEFLSAKIPKSIERKVAASVIEEQTRLKALQEQINPHFLYNTLESIRGEALVAGADHIANMVEILSSIFRFSISLRHDFVRIFEEMDNIYNYFLIQKYRFGDRIQLSVCCEDKRLFDCMIPKLLLQPIVENSILHGLENREKKGKVYITIIQMDEDLMLTFKDNGDGMETEQMDRLNQIFENPLQMGHEEEGSGIALKNVSKRIKLYYGNEYGIHVFSAPGQGTELIMRLPVVYEEEYFRKEKGEP